MVGLLLEAGFWVAGFAPLLAWGWLLTARGGYWRGGPRLEALDKPAEGRAELPPVCAIVPARDEARVLPETLPSLLDQNYAGPFQVILVDDHSSDGTAKVARQVARQTARGKRLRVIQAEALPPGWSGKLWAMEQGLRAAAAESRGFVLFTDADVHHPKDGLRTLVVKAQEERLGLVSVMVQLKMGSLWDRLLIPAFVYFFAKLYPFRWSNDPHRRTAAAAGGCLLVARDALDRAGGLEPISGELIDDCALARLLKEHRTATWLGLSRAWRSTREYGRLAELWNMVARTAFHQLRYSGLYLVGCVLGMAVLYLAPPLLCGAAFLARGLPAGTRIPLALAGGVAWGAMAWSYAPMLRWYGLPLRYAPLLPVSAALYILMTLHSALRHWAGRGGAWKGRFYGRGSGRFEKEV